MHKNDRVDEFVTLYMQNSRRVHGFVRALVPHKPDAEDVFQDVSRTLWAKFDQFESGTNFLVWAFSVARFKVLQHRRSQRRLPVSLSDAALDLVAQDILASARQVDSRVSILAECLKKLPEPDRDLIEARYRLGQTTKSVAEARKRSIDAIYRSLRRIHKSLLSCVQRQLAEDGLS